MTDSRLATKSHTHVWNRYKLIPPHFIMGGPPATLKTWRCPCGEFTHHPDKDNTCLLCELTVNR